MVLCCCFYIFIFNDLLCKLIIKFFYLLERSSKCFCQTSRSLFVLKSFLFFKFWFDFSPAFVGKNVIFRRTRPFRVAVRSLFEFWNVLARFLSLLSYLYPFSSLPHSSYGAEKRKRRCVSIPGRSSVLILLVVRLFSLNYYYFFRHCPIGGRSRVVRIANNRGGSSVFSSNFRISFLVFFLPQNAVGTGY